MTRTYDSKLPGAVRTLLRDGVIALLQPLTRAAGQFAAGAFPLAMPVRSFVNEENLIGAINEACGGAAPSYLVAIGDMKSDRTAGTGSNKASYEVDVVCYSTYNAGLRTKGRLASDERAKLDDTLDPGIDVMLELAWMLVTDKRVPEIGTKMDVIRLEGETHIVSDNEITIWCLRFGVTMSINVDLTRGLNQYITGLLANHFPSAPPIAPLDPEVDPPTLATLTLTPHPPNP